MAITASYLDKFTVYTPPKPMVQSTFWPDLVPELPIRDPTKALYKGKSKLDDGYIYAPYIPDINLNLKSVQVTAAPRKLSKTWPAS